MNYLLRTRTARVRLARFRHHYGKIAIVALSIVALITVIAALLRLLSPHFPFAWLGILGLVSSWLYFLATAQWRASSPTYLEDILDEDILGRLSEHDDLSSLWPKLAKTPSGNFVLSRLGLDPVILTSIISAASIPLAIVWERADAIRVVNDSSLISGGFIVAGILQHNLVATHLPQYNVTIEDIEDVTMWLAAIEKQNHRSKPHYGGFGRDWAVGFTPLLDRYGINLSRQSESSRGALHLAGREDVLNSLLAELENAQTKLVIIGETGIGKSTLLYGLADELLQKSSGRFIHYQIVTLNASILLAEQSTNLENLLLMLFSEAILAGNIIIALDEAQLFFGHGTGAVNLSQLLLPILQDNRLPVILTISPANWVGLKSSSSAVTSLLTPFMLKEMTRAQTIPILGLRAMHLDRQHGSLTLHAALVRAYELSGRYNSDEAYPGRALKLLEAAYAHSTGIISAQAVEAAIEAQYGVKTGTATGLESDALIHLEDELKQRMVGQEHAIHAVSSALRRARAGIANPTRPLGSFLFLGPTGVGKTELTKSLAAVVFGSPERMVRLDMSEYSQSSDVNRVLADTSEGGLLSQIRRNPYSVVLLDEIEKADSSIDNLLLQLLDEGRLTDVSGKAVSFRDAIIIATSNAGAATIANLNTADIDSKHGQSQLIDRLITDKIFKPELLNRFDEVILFAPLSQTELVRIVDLLLANLNQTLAAQNIVVSLTDAAKVALVAAGYDPRFGARPMRRIIQSAIEDSLAKRLLSGAIPPGTTVNFDVSDLELA